jgi:hypothetical protein
VHVRGCCSLSGLGNRERPRKHGVVVERRNTNTDAPRGTVLDSVGFRGALLGVEAPRKRVLNNKQTQNACEIAQASG